MKRFMLTCLTAVAMMVAFTSCSKEENPPAPAPVEEPVVVAPIDMNLHVGFWSVDSVHFSGPNGTNYMLNQGTMDFTGSMLTWSNGSNTAYVLNGTTIDCTSSTDFQVLAVTNNTMTLKSVYVAPPWTAQTLYLTK